MKKWTHAFAALMFALTLVVTSNVFGEEDIFADEGDGDFDVPAAAQAQPAPQPQVNNSTPPAPEAPAPDMAPVEEELATPTIVEETPKSPVSNDELFGDEEPTKPVVMEKKTSKAKVVEVKAPKVEKKHETKHAEKKHVEKKQKVAKVSKGKGHFAWTTGNCKMQRSPASTDSLGETKASKKIWVEDVDHKWVKVWNKDGKEAFLSRDCLK